MATVQFVRKLETFTQAALISGKGYTTDMTFNPIQDASNNWIISEEEYSQIDPNVLVTYPFIDNLEVIAYNPVIDGSLDQAMGIT